MRVTADDVSDAVHTDFRQRLLEVDPAHRDAWVDRVLGLGELPDDRELPPGCAPYLPSAVDVLREAIERAGVTDEDVFVDVGSGVGRALAVVHLLTGAGAVGVEIQADLAARAAEMAARLGLERVRTVHGSAEEMIARLPIGTVFYFYCPFGRERLLRTIDALRPQAEVRPLTLCFVDMPAPDVGWLTPDPSPRGSTSSLVVCRTQLHAADVRT
jgi:hypothetical protein